MKLLITGGHGKLARVLAKCARQRGHTPLALPREELDVRDQEGAYLAVQEASPDVVVHAAALTDVDACETRPKEAEAINATGTANICRAAKRRGARLVYLSTDYVFDGRKGAPYLEDDTPAPVNEYGRSKLLGEAHVGRHCPDALIVRTASPFGEGADFVRFVLQEARKQKTLRIVSDWKSTPTYYEDLARSLLGLIERRAAGVVHLAGGATCSRHEWAGEIVRVRGLSCRVEPAPHAAFNFQAARPPDASLASGRLQALGLPPLRPWHEALVAYLATLPP